MNRFVVTALAAISTAVVGACASPAPKSSADPAAPPAPAPAPVLKSGLDLTGFDRSETSRQLILRSGVPCVHVMETTQAPGVHSVGFSQSAAGQAITQHLLDRGRRRIAFVAAQLDPRVMQLRATFLF